MSRPAENVAAISNKCGTCEQWIKEGKGAIKRMRLSRRSFAANAAGLQRHALACNRGNFLRAGLAWTDHGLVADDAQGKTRSRSARRSSATRALSRFRWPRPRFRRTCFPRFYE